MDWQSKCLGLGGRVTRMDSRPESRVSVTATACVRVGLSLTDTGAAQRCPLATKLRIMWRTHTHPPPPPRTVQELCEGVSYENGCCDEGKEGVGTREDSEEGWAIAQTAASCTP
jgi:hypothetical protein